MSGSKRQWPNPIDDIPLKRLRAVSISSPLSSPTNDHAAPTPSAKAIGPQKYSRVTLEYSQGFQFEFDISQSDSRVTPEYSREARGASRDSEHSRVTLRPNGLCRCPSTSLLPATTSVPQAAQVETSSTINALKTEFGGLGDNNLTGLPLLQMAVGNILGRIIDSEVEARHRQVFDELVSDLTDLVRTLQKHAVELEPRDGPYSITGVVQVICEQTKLIEAQQEYSGASRSVSVKGDEEVMVKCYRGIGALFKRLQSGILLSLRDESKEQEMDTIKKDLCPVYDAYHNAALPISVTKRGGCTQGTRVDLLNTTQDWAYGSNPAKIFWLNGMAGTGKTTIAYTFCEMLQQDKLLGASFFCSRNSPDCKDVNRVVPTVAYQLCHHSSLYRQELYKALKDYSDASRRNVGTQFKHLILEPFERIGEAMPKDAIVVIDALDECADEAGAKIVLDLLIRHAAKLPIKFFIASRPEPIISESMETRTGASRSILWLHDVAESLVQADIKLYLTEALASIDISPSEVGQLTTKAGKLFIFAATAVRYIRPDRGTVNHRKRLLEVLELRPNPENLRHQDTDSLYATILSNALDEKIYTKTELTARRQVLWTVICAREPLTITALAELLDIADEEIWPAIVPLHSVLHQSESTSVVSPLHASFPDFLLAKERAKRFHCDEVIQNPYLAGCCFELMGRSLKFNICNLESSYVFDKNVPNLQKRVNHAISTGLFYSCRYWAEHLTKAPPSPSLLSLLATFLQHHLLFWMEALNLKGQIGQGDIVLSQALAWLPPEDEWPELREFTYDARNFLTSFAGNPTSLSTPHIYISALPFTSKESRVRTNYWPKMRGLVVIEVVATAGRGMSALATWHVGAPVRSIDQSTNSRLVVSGSYNDGVSVWDVSSGVRILGPLEDHDDLQQVSSVAFSPDNSRIAAGSGTIRVWDAHNGDLVIELLRGHPLVVYSVAFSPDGTRLASGLSDRTIRMWDPYTGGAIGDPFQGHQDAVLSVAFSPDGEHLASGSGDNTIRVWNWRTGVAALGPLEGHTGSVNSIAYSSNGSRLASGSEDHTVRVWDMSSGTLLAGPFEGHTRGVLCVSFSPSDIQIVSGSSGGAIHVWEAESGNLLAGPLGEYSTSVEALFTMDGTRILSGSDDGIQVWDARHRTTGATESLGHSVIPSVAISPDGTRAASGSWDGTLCVWDAYSGALVTGPFKGHARWVNSVAFSPDGARIVSGSNDHTLRTWDASTGGMLAGPFEGHTESVSSVTFSPDGSQVVSGSRDKTIRLWDSHSGISVAAPFKGHTEPISSIAFSPVGARIVSGSQDRTVRMWDANTGTVLWRSDAGSRGVTCVAFSSDGTRVVSGLYVGTILVLDASEGTVLHGPLRGHTDEVLSVAFSPDGTHFVSGSDDRTVCVWDVQSGVVVVGPLKGHTKDVTAVAFSPDGARVISSSKDHTIRFWDVATATRPDAASFDGWSINPDGWLIDSQSQRLFWVPSDLRDGFWFPTPSNPIVSNARSTTRVDNTTLLGDRWHQCYDASLGSVSS